MECKWSSIGDSGTRWPNMCIRTAVGWRLFSGSKSRKLSYQNHIIDFSNHRQYLKVIAVLVFFLHATIKYCCWLTFLGKSFIIFIIITIFCSSSARQLSLYTIGSDQCITHLHTTTVDTSPQPLIPHYDYDSSVVTLTGKVFIYL